MKRKTKELEKQGGRWFRTRVNDSEILTLAKKRNICFDKYNRIDYVFWRVIMIIEIDTKGRGSMESKKIQISRIFKKV